MLELYITINFLLLAQRRANRPTTILAWRSVVLSEFPSALQRLATASDSEATMAGAPLALRQLSELDHTIAFQ